MIEIAKLEISGIKCDNTACDFRDDDVRFEDYPDWLNRPCPDCGSNLLTQADFVTSAKIMLAARRINTWANRWLPKFLLRRLDINRNKPTHVELKADGSGKIEIGEIK